MAAAYGGRYDISMSGYRIYQGFKYVVYALLTLNIYFFFTEEWAAAPTRFADGITPPEVIEAFAATIDTAAWVVLLLMFELETYVLEDRHFTRPVRLSLHALRAGCYAFIVYAFYGYLSKVLFLSGAARLDGVADLCALAGTQWSFAATLDEYVRLTLENCGSFPAVDNYVQLRGLSAVVDPAGYVEILRLAWVDVVNSGVWLLVVLLLEVDVRLQEKGRFEGLALTLSNGAKFALYSLLFLAAVYWGIKGDFVDFWDAFLWLGAFIFIELNVFEWRHESHEQSPGSPTAS